MIKSKSRCLNLDPNGDFRKINEINEETWNSNQVLIQKYDIKTGWGESRETKDKFAKKWETVIDEFFINTNRVPEGLNLKSAISA